MTLFETPPDTQKKSRFITWLALAAVVVLGLLLYFRFRYYGEEKAADQFFAAVVAGDMNRAYQLWKPGPNYTMQDFLADWGPDGYYGPVKSFKIDETRAPKGGSGVIVSVEVSPFAPFPDGDIEKGRHTKNVRIWVESKDKSLTFPP